MLSTAEEPCSLARLLSGRESSFGLEVDTGMTDEDAFLRAIQTYPNDRTLRLAYANWLEERGDKRGELIRILEQIRTLPMSSDRYWALKPRLNVLRPSVQKSWLERMGYASPLKCTLRKKTDGRSAGRATAGEVVLLNESATEVAIEYPFHPLFYLNIIVKNSRGVVLATRFYGSIFGAGGDNVLRLQPGGCYIHNVSLLGVPVEDEVKAGVYSGQAIYEYTWWCAESEPLGFELVNDKRLRWPVS
jgi:uncharacterized protein (TIGR02996 family)